jgi:hypothetical protein
MGGLVTEGPFVQRVLKTFWNADGEQTEEGIQITLTAAGLLVTLIAPAARQPWRLS